MKPYPLVDDLLRPLLRVAMPRAGRLYALRRDCSHGRPGYQPGVLFRGPGGFRGAPGPPAGDEPDFCSLAVSYTLLADHLHLLLQAPQRDALGRPLRWFLTETATAFHQLRGHIWERRYRAYLADNALYALAARRYLGRNPVRAGLVDDPATYLWSSCACQAPAMV